MAVVLAGEASSVRVRVLAPAIALACLLLPASAGAQGLPDVGATAAQAVGTATAAVATPPAAAQAVPRRSSRRPLPSVVVQPKAPAAVERVTAPAARAVKSVATHAPAVQVPATPTAHDVTRAVGETAAPVTRLAGDTLAATRDRVRETAAALDRVVGTSLAPVSSIFGTTAAHSTASLFAADGVVGGGAVPGTPGTLTVPAGQALGARCRRSRDRCRLPRVPSPPRRRDLRHAPPRACPPCGTPSRSPGPAPSAPELPAAPSGGASIAPGGLMFAGFLALFGAAALLLVGPTRRLRLAPAALGPAPFISLLERPG